MTRQTDLAYLAGLIDGEGCIYISRQLMYGKPYYSATLDVSMTGAAPLKLLSKYLNRPVNRNKSRGGFGDYKQDMFQVTVGGEPLVEFLVELLPYMRLKKPQALNAMKLVEVKKQAKTDDKVYSEPITYSRRVGSGPTPDEVVTSKSRPWSYKPKYTKRMERLYQSNRLLNAGKNGVVPR